MRLRTLIDYFIYSRRNHLFSFLPGKMEIPLPPPLESGWALEFPAEIDALHPEQFQDGQQEFTALKKRTAAGDQLGVILHGHQVVHRSLLQTRGYAAVEADPRALLLQPQQFYIHFCRTSTAAQGKGLYPHMLIHLLCHIEQHAPLQAEVLIACHQNNRASIRGILKAGFVYQKSNFAISLGQGRLAHSFWYVLPPSQRAQVEMPA